MTSRLVAPCAALSLLATPPLPAAPVGQMQSAPRGQQVLHAVQVSVGSGQVPQPLAAPPAPAAPPLPAPPGPPVPPFPPEPFSTAHSWFTQAQAPVGTGQMTLQKIVWGGAVAAQTSEQQKRVCHLQSLSEVQEYVIPVPPAPPVPLPAPAAPAVPPPVPVPVLPPPPPP